MRRALLLLVLLTLPGSTAARGSVDPFYDRLYREGLNARAAGDTGLAARKLRLACFGMLDDPTALAACLGQVALVAAARGETQNVRETVNRLLELERLFQALTKASAAPTGAAALPLLGAADREGIDGLIRLNASPQAVADIPSFRLLGLRMMPAAERQRELDRKIAVEPRNTDWRQLLAELFYEQKQYAEAAREAQHVLDLKPGTGGGHCLRGLSRVRLDDCGDATLQDLDHCLPPAQLGAALEKIACYLKRQDAAAARGVLGRLSEAERGLETAKNLEKELVKLEKKSGG